jgi:hypothetical protein
MRIQVVQRAEEHTVYAKNAFASQVGKEMPVTVAGQPIGTGKLLAAQVSDDGADVSLTFEVPDDARQWLEAGVGRGGFSLGSFLEHPVPPSGTDGPWPREVTGAHVEICPPARPSGG